MKIEKYLLIIAALFVVSTVRLTCLDYSAVKRLIHNNEVRSSYTEKVDIYRHNRKVIYSYLISKKKLCAKISSSCLLCVELSD